MSADAIGGFFMLQHRKNSTNEAKQNSETSTTLSPQKIHSADPALPQPYSNISTRTLWWHRNQPWTHQLQSLREDCTQKLPSTSLFDLQRIVSCEMSQEYFADNQHSSKGNNLDMSPLSLFSSSFPQHPHYWWNAGWFSSCRWSYRPTLNHPWR